MSNEPYIAEIPVPPAPPRDPAWGWLDLLGYVAIAFLSLILCTSVGIFASRFLPAFEKMPILDLDKEPLFLVPVQALGMFITYLLIRMLVTVKAKKDFWAAISFKLPESKTIAIYLAIGVVMAFVMQLA